MHPRALWWLGSLAGCVLTCVTGCATGGPENAGGARAFRAQALGARMPVPSEPGLIYVVAATPGGPRRAVLDALDAQGAVIASDTSSGPLGLPRLAIPLGTRFVRLRAQGALSPRERKAGLSVYADDPRDDDGDGVGHALERAIGTCDGLDESHCAHGPLAAYYKQVRSGTRDSDRDGLPDGDELWGVSVNRAGPRARELLDLPRFGADPMHKDVFVEIDRSKTVEPPGLYEEDLVQIASLFAQGSAAALRNPDRKPGVHLHFDIGFEPADDAHLGLLGDWGGSGESDGDYKKARARDFNAERARYFRYAVLARSGFGQSNGDSLGINRDWNRVALFAHELAHTLGLKHHGDNAWGAVNCKPNHLSIINYAYQNTPAVGFSTHERSMFTQPFNPRGVLERSAVEPTIAALLRAPPFELDVVSDGPVTGVDWNRDGRISEVPVRAGLTWATYKSCDSAGVGRVTLAKDVARTSPAVVALDGALHAFWIDGVGALAHRRVRLRTTDRACSARQPERCTKLGEASSVAGLTDVQQVVGVALGAGSPAIALAHVAKDGALGVSVLSVESDPLSASKTTLIPGASTQHARTQHARTLHAPTIAWMDVDRERYGASRVLSVLFRSDDAQGTLMQASALSPEGPFRTRPVLDDALQPITTPIAPAVAMIGAAPNQELCGAFVDQESFIRFYCYEAARDVWRNLTSQAFYAGLGPKTGGPVGIAYHRFLASDGAPLDPSSEARGAVYLSFTEPAPGKNERPDNPQLLISQWLDAAHPATSAIDFRWRGNVVNQWTHVAAGSSLTLYEDDTLTHLIGAMTLRTQDGPTLELLPMLDGSFDMDLRVGDDFEVMERGICAVLRGDRACGDSKTGSY